MDEINAITWFAVLIRFTRLDSVNTTVYVLAAEIRILRGLKKVVLQRSPGKALLPVENIKFLRSDGDLSLLPYRQETNWIKFILLGTP